MTSDLTGWQPIETAPRDGTPILVHVLETVQLWGIEWLEKLFGTNVTIAAWIGGDDGLEAGWVAAATAIALLAGRRKMVGSLFIKPTHWMPLPAPPDLLGLMDELPASRLPLSTRAKRALDYGGVRTVRDLKQLVATTSDEEFLRWPRFGPATLAEIKRAARSFKRPQVD